MKITSVIVTYNRRDCLNKLLDIYETLKYKPDNIIIVNNNSNDGTRELLEEWMIKDTTYSKYVINMTENLGGSGGFFEGIKKAQELDSDWIYISDDDAYPSKDVLYIFKEFIKNNNVTDIAAICGTVTNCGKIDKSHRRRIIQGAFRISEVEVGEEEYASNFELELFSYVGTMLNSKYLLKCGLTEKDYFIYYDDTEHSLRLSKEGKIICIPSAIICHDVPANLENNISWKTYYGLRNRLLMINKHYGIRYFMIEYIIGLLKIFIFKLIGKKEKAKLMSKSFNDAKSNIQGIDKLYKPGWSLEK